MYLAFTVIFFFLSQCGRNEKVIEQTFRMVERAFSVASGDSDLATELGYQMVLQGKIKEAMKWYKTAMTLDETSVSALTGNLLQCLTCCLLNTHAVMSGYLTLFMLRRYNPLPADRRPHRRRRTTVGISNRDSTINWKIRGDVFL